jgi:hypothetical protein
MGMVRINPFHKTTKDDSQVFRVFGNIEAYTNKQAKQSQRSEDRSRREDPPDLEYIQGWMDELTAPIKLEGSNLIWSAFFKINERIANGFRKERAFLIGGKSTY